MLKRLKFISLYKICIFALFCIELAYSQNLYVFHPSPIRPRNLQEQLSSACPDFEISVFGRYRDFAAMIKQQPPDALLASNTILKATEGYSITMQGKRNSRSTESCFLITDNKEFNIENVDNLTIGILDLFGASGTKEFIYSALSAKPRIRKVTKIEDLVPLILFDMAHALIVSEAQAEYIYSISKIEFKSIKLTSTHIGIAALATSDTASAEGIANCIKTIDKHFLEMLGVSIWQ